MRTSIALAESGWMPDGLIRFGIRKLLAKRLEGLAKGSRRADEQQRIVELLSRDALAIETKAANDQHYEVPASFFQKVLGKRLKYSCCLFESGQTSLDEAEESMLETTCHRASLADGQHILELGCGWGSLTVWMAEKFPAAQITAVSNSRSQREFIERQLKLRGLRNVCVVTCDVNHFQPDHRFDRVVSVEMFEHLRNYREILRRISEWLTPQGRLFVHVFCHRHSAYLFDTQGADNWMGRNFFTGGTMPSADLFSHFRQDLHIEQQWTVNGLHYWQTCEYWLQNLDKFSDELLEIFAAEMERKRAAVTLRRWRIFFMACAELFRFDEGREWHVCHYLFRPAGA